MAVAVPANLTEGGSGLSPAGNGTVTVVAALREAAADLAALKGANVTDAAAVAVAGTPTALGGSAVAVIATADGSDPATTQALANATKANVNLLNARVEAMGTALNALVTVCLEIKATLNAAVLLANGFRTIQRARAALTTGLTAP